MLTQKHCRKCLNTKPTTEFYRSKESPDGFRWWCKKCFISCSTNWTQKHREQKKEYMREYAKTHKAAHNKRNRAWEKANPLKRLAKNRKYRAAHPERSREWSAKYRRLHPDYNAVKHARHRAAILRAAGFCSRQALEARIAYYGSKCYMCGEDYAHIDHVIPLSKGGSNWPANLRPACATCNLQKHSKRLN